MLKSVTLIPTTNALYTSDTQDDQGQAGGKRMAVTMPIDSTENEFNTQEWKIICTPIKGALFIMPCGLTEEQLRVCSAMKNDVPTNGSFIYLNHSVRQLLIGLLLLLRCRGMVALW